MKRTRNRDSNRRLGAALLAAVLMLPAGAGAQVAAPAPAAQDAQRTAGWVFTPTLGAGGIWDDNVLLVHPGDLPPADYAAPVNPSLSLDYTGRRLQFSTGYEGSLTFYRSLDELNSVDHVFRAFLQHRLTRRVTIFGQESFVRSPTTDALMLNTGIPFYRVGSRTNAVGGGLSAALQRHLSLRGAYTLRAVRFEFDDLLGRTLHGGHAHEVDVSLDRALTPRLTIGGEYEFDAVAVGLGPAPGILESGVPENGLPRVAQTGVLTPGVLAPPAGPEDRFAIQSGSFTLRYLIHPAVALTGAVGVGHLGAGLTHEAQTAPAFRIGLTHQSPHLTASAGYRRAYVPSFGFGGSFQNEEWQASITVPFARNRAFLEGGTVWFVNQAIQPNHPDLQSLWLSARLGYRLTPWLRVEGFYSRARQDSDRPGGQLSRNQAGFQIVTVKPIRLR